MDKKKQNLRRKPEWLKIKIPEGKKYVNLKDLVQKHHLHTICESGHCPNVADCWGRGTATFMILGDICTRSCKFCNVKTGKPLPVDWDEPKKLAESVKKMKVKHCVITSVDRDDLEDGGAAFWAATIREIKKVNPETTIEALIPDFDGRLDCLETVFESKPEVISHNLETVKRLTPLVRSKAKYETSLKVIRHISDAGIVSKSGIMLGLGEKEEEIIETMDDLRAVDCKVFTLGQYLQPTRNHLPVAEYITPEQFARYKKIGLEKGFRFVESSPLVRSSYHAEKHV